MRTIIVAASMLIVCTTASAGAEGLSTQYLGCIDRAGSSTVQSGMCAQKEIVSQDGRLNKAYRQVMRQLAARPAERSALLNRQRAWLKARDYACDIDGGTFDMTCVVERTARRADQLERMIRF